jgi:hypothetical protein
MQTIELQLWNYIEGTASQQEIIYIEQMIATDNVWQAQYKELQDLNQLLATRITLDQPSMRFSKNVMEQIVMVRALPSTIHYINKKIIRSIAAVFIFTLVALLVYSFIVNNHTAANTTATLPVNINNGIINNINFKVLLGGPWLKLFMMANVVLLLALLERVLRPGKKINLVG